MADSEKRLVHLDFKRCPLKVDYLQQLFPELSKWGATGLLLEWEDTFPYWGRLASIGSLSSTKDSPYSEADVRKILELAAENNLTTVSLVQTFGHLEFVLKQPEFKDLREVAKYPSSMCPAHPLALPLVTEMLDQVIQLSPGATHVHIGADEVWHLGLCSQCSTKPRPQVFLSHVLAVLRHLHTKHPHIQPVMWDDMLRNIELAVLEESGIGELVEPMVWHYSAAHSFSLTQEMWHKYSRVFPRVWLASAFKGATSSCQILPQPVHHVSNHEQWLLTRDYIEDMFQQVCGIALTGWSRYDHYATMCELLPAALPVLALCLRVWTSRGYSDQLMCSVSKQLGCSESPVPLYQFPSVERPQEPTYPGWRVAKGVKQLAILRCKQTATLHCDQTKTWLNMWQIQNNFTNPMQIQSLHHTMKEMKKDWDRLEQELEQSLPEVFYEKTIEEWVGTLVTPKLQLLNSMLETVSRQLQINT